MFDSTWNLDPDSIEEMNEEVRHEFALDAEECSGDWEFNPAAWRNGKRIDRFKDDVIAYIEANFSRPLKNRDLIEWIDGVRIRLVLAPERHPWARLNRRFCEVMNPPQQPRDPSEFGPYVKVDCSGLELLMQLVRFTMGPRGAEWAMEKDLERLLEIASLPSPGGLLSDIAGDYRRLALDAYVRGRSPDSIVWCRAALENEVNANLVASGISMPDTMRKKLHAAVKCRVLSPHLRDAGFAVWTRGSRVAHCDPWLVKNALGTIEYTMLVLVDLEKRRQ